MSKIHSVSVSHVSFLTNLECLSSFLHCTSLRKCELSEKNFQKLTAMFPSLLESVHPLASLLSLWMDSPWPYLDQPPICALHLLPSWMFAFGWMSNRHLRVNTSKTTLLNFPADYLISGNGSSSLTVPQDKALGFSLPLTPHILCVRLWRAPDVPQSYFIQSLVL